MLLGDDLAHRGLAAASLANQQHWLPEKGGKLVKRAVKYTGTLQCITNVMQDIYGRITI